MRRTSVLVCTLCVANFGIPARAQTLARLTGQVVDPTKAVVPEATIVVENPATGLRRESATDDRGMYAVPELPIGDYKITASKSGFRPQASPLTHLGVGASVLMDFELLVGPSEESVSVTAELPLINPAESPGMLLLNDQIVDLPINGRDYARFSLLTTGAVARTNYIADLSFNGLQTVNNQFAIDGVDATRVDQPYMSNGYERGARLLTGSLDTIQEFSIQTTDYQARYGRAAGSFINIATRSGTNVYHGSVFDFLRNDFFDARNFFNVQPAPQAELRFQNFGANLGGPLRRDRTFVFMNYEGSRQRLGVTGSGTAPSALLRQQVASASPALIPLLSNYPIGSAGTTNPSVDLYTTVAASTVREDTASIRVDHTLSANNMLFVRVNVNDSRVFGPLFAVSASALGPSDKQNVPVRTSNAAFHAQHIFSPSLLGEVLAGVQRFGSDLGQDNPFPLVAVSGLTVNPGSRGWTEANNTSFQLGGMMSYIRGAHYFQWGATAYRVQADRRASNTSVLFYTSLIDFTANSLFQAVQIAGDPGSAVRAWQGGTFVQDSWHVSSRWIINYGVRYDYATPPYDPCGRAQTFDPRTGALAAPGAPYFQSNRTDFSPRLGAAYHLLSNLLVRAGYGIFSQAYPIGNASPIALNTIPGNSTLIRTVIPQLSYPITPFLGQGILSLPSVTGFNWNNPDTRSQQWNVAVGWQVSASSLLEATYVGNRGENLGRSLSANLFDPALNRTPNPLFSSITLQTATGRSNYNAMQLSFRHPFRNKILFGLNYTWAHALDDVQDTGLYSTNPQDNRNLEAEWGNGSGDIRHAVSYHVLYELPIARSNRWLGGWQLSSVGLIHSGVATTVLLGKNTSGNGQIANQRPNAVSGVNPYPAVQSAGHWLNPSAFAIPSSGTFGNLGRNTVVAPGLVQLDGALAKQTRVTEKVSTQLRLEVFNLLNHPNFAPPDTTLGDVTFGQILSTTGRTLGMGTSRQMQLAMKILF